MTKRYLLLLLLFTQSCAFISYSEIIPLIKDVTVGGEDIELTNEYIAQQPYSFIRVDLGKGANIIMVLQKIENGFYTWVSEDEEKITTYNGKIINTAGLIFNMDIINPSMFKYFSNSNLYSGTYDTFLKDPKAYIEQDFQISMVEEGEDFLLFEEKIVVKVLNTEYSNFYWLDRTSGLPKKTKQDIHPSLPTLRIDFIYKY
jgi:hypothetical protein